MRRLFVSILILLFISLSAHGQDIIAGKLIVRNYTDQRGPLFNANYYAGTQSGVAHGITTIANTGIYWKVQAISATAGGAYIYALSDTDAKPLEIWGIFGSTNPTDTTPAVKLIGAKKNGTGVDDLGNDETVLSIANNNNADIFKITGNGTVTLTTALPQASGGTGANMDIFMGLYNREGSDKWAIKGYSVAADRYTLQTPAKLAVYLNSKVYSVTSIAYLDLSAEATWDAVAPTDYRVAATRAGVQFYIYACEQVGNALKVLVSANASAPSGYTTTTSRLIGGFHCLCLSVGTIAGHTLTGFVTGDILPNSVWDYNFRPISSPTGMVYSPKTGLWVDIYLTSGTGANTASAFGGTISDTRDWNSFVDDGGAVSKRLLFDAEFQLIADGSNEETNITGSADPVTTGGHVDTAGRRMIANNGCEDLCGVMWQWLQDNGYRYDGGSHSHTVQVTYKAVATGVQVYKDQTETNLNAVTGTGANETVNTSSVDPAPGWAYYNLPGAKGSLYKQGTYGDIKLIAGAYWDSGASSGSRSRGADRYRWNASAGIGSRFASEPLNR